MSLRPVVQLSSADILQDTFSPSSSRPADYGSSFRLRLFHHSGVVTYADKKDTTFRTPADPPVYTAAVRALNILEVATIIATNLLPIRPVPVNAPENETNTHRNVVSFSRVCTELYLSSMRVLYARVSWLPSIWFTIVDSTMTLSYPQTDILVSNPELLLFVLRLQYTKRSVWDEPDSVTAFKFRRLLFITAQVRALNIDNNHFSRETFRYILSLLPEHRRVFLPGVRTLSWVDDEYLIPAFLSAVPDSSDAEAPIPGLGSRTWLPFDQKAVGVVNLQIHRLISPVDQSANQHLFYATLQQLRTQCRDIFTRLGTLLFLICRNHYNKPSWVSRLVVNEIGRVILASDAATLSADIPMPPATLPFSQSRIITAGYAEGLAVGGYVSHAPVLNAAGETAEGSTPPDAYPIIAAHLVTTNAMLAMSCITNMSAAVLQGRHPLLRIVAPAMKFIGLETIILHLHSVSLRLSHTDLQVFGQTWRNLRTLDLRFKTIVVNMHLDIIKVSSVQAMSTMDCAELLKRVHLPELDVRNFRNITNDRQDALTTLTSSVLYFNDNEILDVCAALLSAFPNLTTVTGPDSAPGWARFAEGLAYIREKRRAERARHADRVHETLLENMVATAEARLDFLAHLP